MHSLSSQQKHPRTRAVRCALLAVAAFTAIASAFASRPQARLSAPIDDATRVTVAGTRSPRALAEHDTGVVSPGTELQGMTLVFSRTGAQEKALQTLLAAQQDPASALFHQWLTPAEFAANFGLADADLARVEGWLQSQGFQVTGVSNSHDRVFFSGSAAQVAQAFRTQLHHFRASNGETNFAPATDISLPVALAKVVQHVGNLSSFRPHPHVRVKPAALATPNFTSAQSGSHFLTPKDLATIYDINAAYNAGYTGAGQSIAVVGQTAVTPSDITSFQSAAGLSTRAPTLVLVPGTGTSTHSTGDEGEADLDLEYTGGVAKDATIYFVYTGSSQNYGVFDALEYAIDNRIAPVISVSYGSCEAELSASNFAQLNAMLAQASAQGQTVVAASGDNGSTDCHEFTDLSATLQNSLAVDFPSDSPYVTGLGGTMFTSAAVAAGSSYWQSASGSDLIGSARSYMPEQVWNNDSTADLSSGGGGVSVLSARPSWQTGVAGITSGSFRLTPDISLAASPDNAGYLYCSSDSQSTGITGSCTHGFRDSSNNYLTVAGGTSFAAPVFAGMLAILNQKLASTGQGNINPTLYTLAANSTTYASVFHDITTGSNACLVGAACTTLGASAYAATVGYDSASGLGSVDFNNLMNAWPNGAGTSTTTSASATTLTAATLTPGNGAADLITLAVANAGSATATPTGTLKLTVDGVTVNSALALSAGLATYTFSSTIGGTHTVAATYSGDSVYGASSGSLTLTVAAAAGKSFSLSGGNVAVTAGNAGTSTVVVTPANGYTGTVRYTVTPNTTLANVCYTLPSAAVTGSAAASSTLTVYTSAAACSSTQGVTTLGNIARPASSGTSGAPFVTASSSGMGTSSAVRIAAITFAGLLTLLGFTQRRRLTARKLRTITPLLALAALGILGFTTTGCGSNIVPNAATNSGSGTATTNATPGAYTLTITGTDTATSTLTSTTTVSLTIQ